jgi:Winged helix DNA-binding domain
MMATVPKAAKLLDCRTRWLHSRSTIVDCCGCIPASFVGDNGMVSVLTSEEVLAIRMNSLLLASTGPRSPADVVTWMGALQAQDVASGEWSFGVRCPGFTQADVHQATVDRHILRTWPMRGTVHFVPPADAKWMLDLTGARVIAGASGRFQQLGLAAPVLEKAVELLRSALNGGRSLTRGGCVALLVDAGVHTAPGHGYHLLSYASHIGVTCIGPHEGKEQTFVLLDDWVPNPNVLSRDEALATLTCRYYQSHGPASRTDFIGWTGLTVTDAKRGIELLGDQLATISTVRGPMITSAASLDTPTTSMRTADLLLLPGFDEYLLGYKDRTSMVAPERMNQIVPGRNGVFKPTIVVHGKVIGTWKRTIKNQRVDIEALPFEPFNGHLQDLFGEAGHKYADYLKLEPRIITTSRS